MVFRLFGSRLNVCGLLGRRRNDNILDLFVAELKIFLHRDRILNLHKDHRCSDDERGAEAGPCCGEDGVEWLANAIQTPEDGGAGGLNTLVET
jgi:hypothetical protein